LIKKGRRTERNFLEDTKCQSKEREDRGGKVERGREVGQAAAHRCPGSERKKSGRGLGGLVEGVIPSLLGVKGKWH